MATIVFSVMEFMSNPHSTVIENISPIVREWPLMGTPIYPISISIVYLFFCLSLGPNLMKNRKAFEIEKIMIAYNAVQMAINVYLFQKCINEVLFAPNFSLIIKGDIDRSDENWIYVYYYFLNKVFDLVDTIFMVLRKKNSQITFLHLYHHAMMVIVSWIFVAYVGLTVSAIFGFINTFVHSIMYFYYLLTAAKPEYKKSVWWKRHLTQLQLGQFVIVTVHAVINVLIPSSKFPKGVVAIFIPQGIIMFALFWDFYKKAYKKKGNSK